MGILPPVRTGASIGKGIALNEISIPRFYQRRTRFTFVRFLFRDIIIISQFKSHIVVFTHRSFSLRDFVIDLLQHALQI